MNLLNKMFFMGLTILITIATNIVTIILIARSLGVEEFGTFAYFTTLSAMAMLFVNYGYSISLPKEIASSSDEAIALMERSLSVKLFIFAHFFIVFLLYSIFSNQMVLMLFFMTLSTFTFASHFNLLSRGLENFAFETKNMLIGNVLLIVFVMMTYYYFPSLLNYAMAYFFARALHFIFVLKSIKKMMLNIRVLRLTYSQCIKSLKQNFAYAIDSVTMSAFGVVDVLLVKLLFGFTSVGLYQAGMKFVLGVLPIIQVVSNVFIPRISNHGGQRYESLLLVISLAMAILVSIGFYLVFDSAVMLLLGESYLSLLELSPYFTLIVFLKFAAAGLGILAITKNMQKVRTKVNIVSLVIFILISLIFSNELGLKSVLVGYAISLVFTFFSYFFLLRGRNVFGINLYLASVSGLLFTAFILNKSG